MVSCFPHASRLSHLPSILRSVGAACFWLVVAFQISIGGRIRPRRIFVFIFVRRSVHHPKRWYSVRPTRSVQIARPPEYPPHRDRRLLVGCFVVCSNCGHRRSRPHPSLCFWGVAFRHPERRNQQWREHNRRREPCIGPWGAAAPRFGSMADVAMEREGQSRWRVGRQWLMLVVVCCDCILCCASR